MPQRSQVSGMNCIQPTAPAELGPMLRPKFDSTLLIAASTCHGMPYADPARCQTPSSCVYESCEAATGGVESEGGKTTEPGAFGAAKLGRPSGVVTVGTTAKVSARADPARIESVSA